MRRLLTAGAAVALALTGLVAVAPRATADSTVCHNGNPTGWTETTLVNTVVYVGVQRNTTGGYYVLGLCYSDTPTGAPSTLVGGQVEIVAEQPAPGRWDVTLKCHGDSPTMLATVNCDGRGSATTTTTTTTSPPSAGASISGWTLLNGSTVTLGTTGANTGTVSTTSTNPEVHYGGTCATAAGTTPPGSRCTSGTVDAEVARGDVGTVSGTTTTCLVTAGSSCLVYRPKAGIVLWGDATNETYVELLGTRPLPADPGSAQCYGSC